VTTFPLYLRLRELREARRISIVAASREMGLYPAVLGSYERGDRAPTPIRLDAVLRHYGERLASVPADVTDEELAAALVLVRVHRVSGEFGEAA
jgi:transcriptional regulator with XRE-family HTH domain